MELIKQLREIEELENLNDFELMIEEIEKEWDDE